MNLSALLLSIALNAGSLAIENVTVEVGDGTVLQRANVLVKDGKIAAVTSGPLVADQRIDGSAKILSPGFVHPNSPVGLFEVEMVKSSRDDRVEEKIVPGFNPAYGFNGLSTRLLIQAKQGVTDFVLARRRGTVTGLGVAAQSKPSATIQLNPSPVAMFASIDSSNTDGARSTAWMKLRELFAEARYIKKNKASYMRGQSAPLSYSPFHLEALDPVLNKKVPLVLSAQRSTDILRAIEFAKSEDIKLVIEGGAQAWMVAGQLKAANVPVIVYQTDMYPWDFDALGARDDAAAILEKAGVKIILGAGDKPGRQRQMAGMAVAYGLSRNAALSAITKNTAEVFFPKRKVGMLKEGFEANMVLWSGDPLEVRSVAELVLIKGERIPLEQDRQRRLAERYAPSSNK